MKVDTMKMLERDRDAMSPHFANGADKGRDEVARGKIVKKELDFVLSSRHNDLNKRMAEAMRRM